MLEPRFVRFLASGGANTLLTFGLFALLSPRLGPHWAYTIIYAIGIVIAYASSTLLVFRVQPSVSSAAMFPVVYIAQFVWGLGLMTLMVDWLGWNDLAGLAVVTATSVPLTYVLTRRLLKE